MIYAIGDIHGQTAQMDRALALIDADGGPDATIVFVGDYTDRGPDSRGVIDRLLQGRADGRPWTAIMGNHDRLFLRYVTEGAEHDNRVKSNISWLNHRLGGDTTLGSYGLGDGAPPAFLRDDTGFEWLSEWRDGDSKLGPQEVVAAARAAVPDDHLNFLATLPLWHETDDLVFVHAGIRPGTPLAEQDEDDLLWIRDGWLENTDDHGKLIIHGHTALDAPEAYPNRVNIDGGAGYGRPLVPVAFDGRDAWTLSGSGRTPLVAAG